jgi:hypothetical protein
MTSKGTVGALMVLERKIPVTLKDDNINLDLDAPSVLLCPFDNRTLLARPFSRSTGRERPKGLSTRVQIRVPIAVRFCARFAAKGLKVLILYHTHITTVSKHILEKNQFQIRLQSTFGTNSFTESYADSCAISRTNRHMIECTISCQRPLPI